MTSEIRVLIVDDDSALTTLLSMALEQRSLYENKIIVVGRTGDGLESVDLALKLKPDIVLMDIMLVGMNGLEATELITKYAPSIRVIILSAAGGADSLRRAIKSGAVDFLVKPIHLDGLLTSILCAYQIGKENPSLRLSTANLETEEILLRVAEVEQLLEVYSHDFIKGCLVDHLNRLALGIAHDLRSPLNVVLGILDTIDEHPAQIGKYLERIRRRAQYCRWMIDNFLSVSFTEKPCMSDINLLSLVDQSLEILGSKMPPGINVSIRVPKNVKVQSDFNLLRLVLMNLIDNAIESMPDGGNLRIFARRSNSRMWISVRDTGPGISKKNEQHLFKIGFTTKPAHCGLGLYVARRVMRQLFGDVVYTKNDGPGSTFRISVPLDPTLSRQGNPDELYRELRFLELQLGKIRARPLTEEQKEQIFLEFQRLISVFANHLYNELNLIELTATEIQSRIEDDKLRHALMKIAQNCAYSRLLARNLEEVGGKSQPNYNLVSPARVIEYVLGLLERKIPPDQYRIEWEIDPSLEEIEADEVALKQVFMNLIRNALDAMPDGGVLKFHIAREGNAAKIVVSDSGAGIPPENLYRLFTLGFTTRPRGYGVGLYSVKSIINKHKGTIEVASRVGEGTKFIIRLPISQAGEGINGEKTQTLAR